MIKFKHHNCPNIFKPVFSLPQVGPGADERRVVAGKGSKAHELRSINDEIIEISYWSQI